MFTWREYKTTTKGLLVSATDVDIQHNRLYTKNKEFKTKNKRTRPQIMGMVTTMADGGRMTQYRYQD